MEYEKHFIPWRLFARAMAAAASPSLELAFDALVKLRQVGPAGQQLAGEHGHGV